ncbi:MAG: VOC family protein [bacterium]
MTLQTYGLTHLAIATRDVDRAFEFYEMMFGMAPVFRSSTFLQAQTPGAHDVLVFEQSDTVTGDTRDIAHFGFRLRAPMDIDAAATMVEAAGGTVVEQGEFVPGEPYVFARDRDGYLVEIWYELPTRLDPVG